MKKKIVLATPQRRICSALIDIGLGLGVAVLAYFFGSNQAGAAIANPASYHEKLVKYQVDSGLVIKDNGSYYYLTQDPNKNYSTYDSLKGNLEFYYNDYLTDELPGKSSGEFCPNVVERKDGIE